MVRLLSGFIVISALTVAAQQPQTPFGVSPQPNSQPLVDTVANGGQAMSTIGVTGAQQVSAGSFALPGSGTPLGAPLQPGVNDANNGGTGYVWAPPAQQNAVSVNGVNESGAIAITSPATGEAATAAQPFRTGIRNFEGGNGGAAASSARVNGQPGAQAALSLAEVAAQFKARRANDRTREYGNEDLMALRNGASRDQIGREIHDNFTLAGNTGGQNAALPAGDEPMALAQTQPALNQRDLAAVNAALARHQNAASQDDGMMAQNDNSAAQLPQNDQAQAGSEQIADQASGNQAATSGRTSRRHPNSGGTNPQLPASGSTLPLMVLLGAGALGAGAAWKFRG